MVVMMVLPGSAADRAGLKAGDLIQQVDRTEVQGLADFFEVLQSSDNQIVLKIYRDDSVLFVQVIAASPFMPIGGRPDTEDDDDDGLKGRPAQIPPMGKPESAAIDKDQGVIGSIELCCEIALGYSHSHTIGKTLAQRPRCGLHARGDVRLRVAWGQASPLTKVFELF